MPEAPKTKPRPARSSPVALVAVLVLVLSGLQLLAGPLVAAARPAPARAAPGAAAAGAALSRYGRVEVVSRLPFGERGRPGAEVPRLLIGPLTAPWPAAEPIDAAAAAARALAELRHVVPELIPDELDAPVVVPLGGGHLLRYAQRHHGVPVLGGELTLRLDERGAAVRLVRDVLEAAALARIGTAPTLTPQEAQRIVQDANRGDTSAAQLHVDLQTGRLCYVVGAVDLRRMENALYLIDAHTGDLVRRIERLSYANNFRVYLNNPVTSAGLMKRPVPAGSDGPYAPTRPGPPAKLDSTLLRAYNCVDGQTTRTVPGAPVALHLCEPGQSDSNSSGDFDDFEELVDARDGRCPLKADANRNGFAEAHMYWHAAHVYERFRGLWKNLGRPDFRLRLSTGTGARPFPLVVNLCMPDQKDLSKAQDPKAPLLNFENAFFSPGDVGGGFSRLLLGRDGDMIAFGMGARANYALDADVIYHEFTHAVVHTRGRLRDPSFRDARGQNDDPGAINEGLADYFSSGLSGDPGVGEYAQKNLPQLSGRGLRNLETPWHCTDDRVGEVHEDSRALSGALWAARKAVAGDPTDPSTAAQRRRDRFDQAVLAALEGSPALPSMSDMARLVLDEVKRLAGDLGADAETKTRAAFTERGVLPECDRILRKAGPKRALCLDGGDGRSVIPGHVQWRLEVGPEQDSLKVALELAEGSCAASSSLVAPPPPRPQLALRRGALPVAWSGDEGTYDRLIDLEASGSSWAATVQLTPGVYHAMLVNSGSSTIARNIRLEPLCSRPQGCEGLFSPDLGAGPDGGPDSGGDGCGCRMGAASRPDAGSIGAAATAAGALALGLAALSRRHGHRRRHGTA